MSRDSLAEKRPGRGRASWAGGQSRSRPIGGRSLSCLSPEQQGARWAVGRGESERCAGRGHQHLAPGDHPRGSVHLLTGAMGALGEGG